MEIIQSGGVDPREWVAEWMEELLSTAVGVVAQQYVAKRMGVGEGGIGRGKQRAEENEAALGDPRGAPGVSCQAPTTTRPSRSTSPGLHLPFAYPNSLR